MIDDLSAQFHHALADVRAKYDAHLEEILHLAARAGCGVSESIQWATTPEGYRIGGESTIDPNAYRIEVEFTIDPDLPPYAVREASGVITQYALREEGDDT